MIAWTTMCTQKDWWLWISRKHWSSDWINKPCQLRWSVSCYHIFWQSVIAYFRWTIFLWNVCLFCNI